MKCENFELKTSPFNFTYINTNCKLEVVYLLIEKSIVLTLRMYDIMATTTLYTCTLNTGT